MSRLTTTSILGGWTLTVPRQEAVNKLAAYEGTSEDPDTLSADLAELAHYRELKVAGRLPELPCKVGDAVFYVSKCEDVCMSRDDDYYTGTGAIDCPFESTCDAEDCNDNHSRIFETTVSDFWFGDQNGCQIDMMIANIGGAIPISDFGKTAFLTHEAAEQALERSTHDNTANSP